MPTDWLLEEYKILQTKIDKIGEDRFKVRTWSVTITMGLSLGAKISSTFSPVTLVFALLTVAIFHLVEHKQRGLGRKLGDRALKLEALIRNRADANGVQNEDNPAHFPEIAGKLRAWASSEYKRKVSQKWSVWDWCVVRADNVFYCVQYVMLGVALGVLTFYPKPAEVAQVAITNSTITVSFVPDSTSAVFHGSANLRIPPCGVIGLSTQSIAGVFILPQTQQGLTSPILMQTSTPGQAVAGQIGSTSNVITPNARMTNIGSNSAVVASNALLKAVVPTNPAP